jgi:hypothetical protein
MLLTDWGETDGTQASLVHFSSKLACGLANFRVANWQLDLFSREYGGS